MGYKTFYNNCNLDYFLFSSTFHSRLIAEEIQKKLRPPYIGIATITLSPHLAAQLRNRPDVGEMDVDRGVFVVDVNNNSPAQQ